MIKKSLYLALPLTLSLLLGGCGSSGGSSDNSEDLATSTPKIFNATFNAKSSGVTYECGSQKGSLADDGTFKFEDGKECTFYDGNNIIQTVTTSQLKNGVAIDEGETETTQTSDTTTAESALAKLLRGKTFYSVQPKDSRVIVLEFEDKVDPSDGKFHVWASYDNAQLGAVYKVVDKTISIPSQSLTFKFIKEETDYLLFDSQRRMYLDRAKAEAFVAANK